VRCHLKNGFIPEQPNAAARITRIYSQYNHLRILPHSRIRQRSPRRTNSLQHGINMASNSDRRIFALELLLIPIHRHTKNPSAPAIWLPN
jgi:hypothetical protein